MSTILHDPDSAERPLDQTNPGDGKTADKRPAPDIKEETAIEAFDEEGAGIAAKE